MLTAHGDFRLQRSTGFVTVPRRFKVPILLFLLSERERALCYDTESNASL